MNIIFQNEKKTAEILRIIALTIGLVFFASTGGAQPVNDNFASRTPIAGSSVTLTASNVGATKESGEPNHAANPGGKSVWWTWTAPGNCPVVISTTGSSFDTTLGIYTGASVAALTPIVADDDGGGNLTSRASFNAVAGTAYQIAVDGYGGASGSIHLNLLAILQPVVVKPPGATVAGKTIAEWSAAWWQWAAALAPPNDPFTDTTGASAGRNQSGPVFFLAGSTGSSSRQFTVPANKYLLVPLFAGELSQLELSFSHTEAQVRLAAKQQADQINSLHATLDGITIASATLFTHREVSPAFSFVAVANNQVGIFAVGNSGIAIADGYFLMLDPPAPGTHVLNYGGGASAFGIFINETDTITVLPPVMLTSANLGGGQFGFGVTGPPGSTVIIQGSGDLSNWQNVSTNVLNGGSNYITGAIQGQSNQFYRARVP